MKTYPKNKFLQLTTERRVQILLDLIYKAEACWEDFSERSNLLGLFSQYFKWMNFFECDSALLRRVATYQSQIASDIELRKLLDIAVPFERYLELSVKDDQLVPVREGDRHNKPRTEMPLYFVLDHLRSAFNVGSLFRTAECLGVSHIFLVGYTPTPDDSGVQKTAMGTDKIVAWSSHNHIEEVFKKLKEENISIVALETSMQAKRLDDWRAPERLAFVVGNERFGLNQKSLQPVDEIVEIPVFGRKNSLNVANALAIASFEVVRQWRK